MRPLITMLGLPADDILEGFRSFNMGQELLNDLLPKMNSEEEAQQVSDLALVIVSLYPYIGHFDNDELNGIDRLLNNPFFEPISKAAQLLFVMLFKRFPNAVRLFFTQEEKDELIRALLNAGAPNTSPEIPIQPEGTNRPTISEEQSENEGLHWPTDEEFLKYPSTGDQTSFYRASKLGSSSALRMSIIYKLFIFLVNQGKLENTQDNLMLFAFRLTGKSPNPIDTKRKLIWLGPRTDYSLCYFVWYVFTNVIDERSKPLDGRFWTKTGLFFEYADGSTYSGGDEQSRRQDLSKGRDMTDPFACALRETMEELVIEQQLLMKGDS